MTNDYYKQLAEMISDRYNSALAEQNLPIQKKHLDVLVNTLIQEFEKEDRFDLSELQELEERTGTATRAYRAICQFTAMDKPKNHIPTKRDVLEFYHYANRHPASYYQFGKKSMELVKLYLEKKELLKSKQP